MPTSNVESSNSWRSRSTRYSFRLGLPTKSKYYPVSGGGFIDVATNLDNLLSVISVLELFQLLLDKSNDFVNDRVKHGASQDRPVPVSIFTLLDLVRRA